MTTRGHSSPIRTILFLLVVMALTLGTNVSAQSEFEEAELFFELNDTDGDLGIHAVVDGGPWEAVDIDGPITDVLRSDESHFDEDTAGTLLLQVRPQGKLRRQGMTELRFESAEPAFDELAPAVFFARFPQGTYRISGRATSGSLPRNLTNLTHVMPAPPGNLRVNGVSLPEDCEEGPVPTASGAANIVIEWDPVETTHPELGTPLGSFDIEIEQYEVVLEQEDFGLSVEQDPDATEFFVPGGLLSPGETKVEILVREKSHNQTATESCFEVE